MALSSGAKAVVATAVLSGFVFFLTRRRRAVSSGPDVHFANVPTWSVTGAAAKQTSVHVVTAPDGKTYDPGTVNVGVSARNQGKAIGDAVVRLRVFVAGREVTDSSTSTGTKAAPLARRAVAADTEQNIQLSFRVPSDAPAGKLTALVEMYTAPSGGIPIDGSKSTRPSPDLGVVSYPAPGTPDMQFSDDPTWSVT